MTKELGIYKISPTDNEQVVLLKLDEAELKAIELHIEKLKESICAISSCASLLDYFWMRTMWAIIFQKS
ncbi:hypothetical protein KEF85_09770 [Methylomonas paludis]|uniref:Uncharacterized protein n=1 Tax=Methylomonas paludis TaxID=1173101 RepID=A0A975R8Y6_9GAMM|nr:hypothetical protein [Methylomonas paludis]QWF69664.1 hypothetical protein KEF85_09770 [Methylomonas paludis]